MRTVGFVVLNEAVSADHTSLTYEVYMYTSGGFKSLIIFHL